MAVSSDWTDEIDAFLAWLRTERGASKETLRAYEGDVRHLLDWMHARPQGAPAPDDVAVADLRGYLAAHIRAHARTTLARRLSAFRTFFGFRVRRRQGTANPAKLVVTPKQPQALVDFLSVDDVFALVERPVDPDRPLDVRNSAMWELLYSSGLRVAELCALDLRDLDLDSAWVRVFGKGSKEREVPLGRKALAVLRRYLDDARPELAERGTGTPALFLNHRGGRLGQRSVRRLLDQDQIRSGTTGRVSPHGVRHTFATHMLSSGADLRAIQDMLGHANIATTERYTHVTLDHLMTVYDDAHPRARRKQRNGTDG